ncbi:DUF4344 domain-containing metallopeptidase [Embleya sp. NPDC008237]|uniref:DUF4344 domain-containing metallopeptidase n=1 Tax=Embleya sp. NPDC008237 TaxID=3363978 RepID=UPI0036E39113
MRISMRRGRGHGRGRLWAGLLAIVLAGCTASDDAIEGIEETDRDVSRSPEQLGFVIRFEQPAEADRGHAAFLHDRKVMEAASARLNAFVGLDHQAFVVARSCGGEGSEYDPEAKRIVICYDQIGEERELFERAGHRPADDEVVAVLVETIYHEAAHHIIDTLRLSFTERAEEDAADQFAALLLLRQGADGERQLLMAVREYELSAADDDVTAGDNDRKDEHSPDLVRAANHLCYLYGSAPGRQRDPASERLLPPPRVTGCANEWARVRDAWMKNLAPILRKQ